MPIQIHLEISTSHITNSDNDLLQRCAEKS